MADKSKPEETEDGKDDKYGLVLPSIAEQLLEGG